MSYGQNPYGQNPYGQNPYGQNPYGQQPYGNPQHQQSAPQWGAPGPGQQPFQGQQPNPHQPPQQPGPQQPGQWGGGPQGPGGPGQPGGPHAGQQSNPWAQPPAHQQAPHQQPPAQPVSATPVPEPEPRKATFRERDLPVVTTETLPGRTVTATLGEVLGVVTRPRDLRPSADLSAVLTEARQDAIDALVAMAKQADADAVIGLRFDGGKVNDGTHEIAAYGTAVTLEPVAEEPNPFVSEAASAEAGDESPADGAASEHDAGEAPAPA